MELMQAIYHRRAVRDYLEKPVSRDTVLKLLEAAIQAPSAVNVQPWAFVIVQDRAMLRRYSDRAKAMMLDPADPQRLPPGFRQTLANPDLRRMLAKPAFNLFYNAGTLIVVCAKPIGQHPDWACCLAAQNLMLAAHGLDLATCPIGFAWPLLAEPDVRRELSIPDDYVPVLPIIVGHPAGATQPVPHSEPHVLCWREAGPGQFEPK